MLCVSFCVCVRFFDGFFEVVWRTAPDIGRASSPLGKHFFRAVPHWPLGWTSATASVRTVSFFFHVRYTCCAFGLNATPSSPTAVDPSGLAAHDWWWVARVRQHVEQQDATRRLRQVLYLLNTVKYIIINFTIRGGSNWLHCSTARARHIWRDYWDYFVKTRLSQYGRRRRQSPGTPPRHPFAGGSVGARTIFLLCHFSPGRPRRDGAVAVAAWPGQHVVWGDWRRR